MPLRQFSPCNAGAIHRRHQRNFIERQFPKLGLVMRVAMIIADDNWKVHNALFKNLGQRPPPNCIRNPTNRGAIREPPGITRYLEMGVQTPHCCRAKRCTIACTAPQARSCTGQEWPRWHKWQAVGGINLTYVIGFFLLITYAPVASDNDGLFLLQGFLHPLNSVRCQTIIEAKIHDDLVSTLALTCAPHVFMLIT